METEQPSAPQNDALCDSNTASPHAVTDAVVESPPIVVILPEATVPAGPEPAAAVETGPVKRRVWLPIVLFLATCGSTYWAWMWWNWHWTYPRFTGHTNPWSDGLIYTCSLLAILVAHEMGHFLQAVRYGIPASLPFFIPMPIGPIGTMGAVIGMQGSDADRKQLFDIGITGPLAGLVVALPLIAFGLSHSQPIQASRFLGEPLIWKAMNYLIHGAVALDARHVVPMNPYSMAGWVGLLVTGLNMLPISQLDGGHVSYALFGRRSFWIARGMLVLGGVFVILTSYYSWLLMLVLLVLMGPAHPPTRDDTVPLGRARTILGLVSLSIPILCFTPIPI